jgi:uncharacterized lipoprotein YmbA
MSAIALSLLSLSCAAPPLSLYTLSPPTPSSPVPPLTSRTVVIELRRVVLPDYLDTQDIVVRDGNTLQRSTRGRWASRLSLAVTSYLAALLAAHRPDALITDQPQVETPNFRIFLTIGTFDVSSSGTVTLEADWSTVPRDPNRPTERQRARLTVDGSVATDQDVVVLMQSVLKQLADRIDVSRLR